MKNGQSEYLKNTLILFVGKFSTQFISILLLPLFTYYLNTTDYGTIDLIQTYISLFVPVFLLCLDTAVFRFLIDNRQKESEKGKIIFNSLLFGILQCILILIIFVIISLFIDFDYLLLTNFNIIAMIMSSITLQICRGLGDNKKYSISMIFTALTNLILNFVLIIKFKFGGSSILIASIVANAISFTYIFFNCNLFNYIKKTNYDKKVIKKLLKYSIPMIPNTLSWWVINVSDRTIISIFINTAANGIYTVSCKFSNIVNSIFSIFIMSWQETASMHINDNDRDEFLSSMIEKILSFFVTLVIGLIAVLPLIFDIVIGKDYSEAYSYIPILLISCIFSIFTSLLGGIYIAKKETKEVAKTSFLSAFINIIINIIFINKIGIYAACLSTLIAYFSMTIYRIIDIKKYIKLKFNIKKMIILSIFVALSSITYYIDNTVISIIVLLNSVVVAFIFNKEFMFEFKNMIFEKLKK